MPQTCPQCQSEAADDAAFCSKCGASLHSAAGPASSSSGVGAPAGAASASSGSTGSTGTSIPAYKFSAARWSLADRIAGVATVVIFISLFLSWFSESVGVILPGTSSVDGLSAHGYLYLVMILCILIVAYLALRAGFDELPAEWNVPHLTVMLVGTLVNLLLVLIAFFSQPPGSGWSLDYGAFIGLFAAIIAAAPYAVPQLRVRTM